MNKKEIRKAMIHRLNEMDLTEHQKKSEQIMKNVMAEEVYQNAKVIGITLSRFPEVDTRPLIQAAWKDGKKVAVPKCIRETRAMDFRILTSFDELETVYMDLLEPIVEKTESVNPEQIDLQIVPGVVFSKKGYRIGFGGGYYDRYMANYSGASLAVAFNCQTGQEIPVEKHDIAVQMMITEQND